MVDAGEPPVLLGTDSGPNAAEYLLHALAACLTTTIVYCAAARKIRLTEVESIVEGDMDVRGCFGIVDGVRNGFTAIRADVPRRGRRAGGAAAGARRERAGALRGVRHDHQRRAGDGLRLRDGLGWARQPALVCPHTRRATDPHRTDTFLAGTGCARQVRDLRVRCPGAARLTVFPDQPQHPLRADGARLDRSGSRSGVAGEERTTHAAEI